MNYDKNGIDIIFSAIQKEYETEEARNKHLETKVQVLLAVSGVLTSALMILLKSILEYSNNIVFDIVMLFASFSMLALAMLCFLSVVRIKVFKQIIYKNLLSNKALHQNSQEIKYNLAHDYFECTQHNRQVGDEKVKHIKNGSNLIVASILIFFIVFLDLAVNIITTERKELMAKDNTTKSGSSTPTTPPRTDRGSSLPRPVHESNNEGPGYGTQPIEKSERGGKK